MAKDKRIGELPGISAAAVMNLNRSGIVSLHDLLAAEFDRVAYAVDDYNEAARLVKEARKITDGGRRQKHAEPLVPTPLSNNQPPSTTRHHTRASAQGAGAIAPGSGPEDSAGVLAGAMSLSLRGCALEGPESGAARAALARRFEIGALLAVHGGTEQELAAAVLVELGEAGAIEAEDVENRCGAAVVSLLEECGSLRAVPVLPSGKAPKYYLEMAAAASREARRVCAALLIVAARAGGASTGGQWHGRLLLEALESGGPDELVSMARAAVDGSRRAAA